MYLNGAAQSRANLFTDDRAASHVSTMLRMSALAVLLVLAISLQDASAQGKPSLCYLPPIRGLCYAYFPSYYYDSSSGTCRNFIYGGCQGNENRFSSREECLQTCG
uniref:Collagen, type VI, alpha n=1 Tax=Rhipicephalus appendiculatus TaxID=34631 RepID=A0A131Z9B7_RHIAP